MLQWYFIQYSGEIFSEEDIRENKKRRIGFIQEF